MKGRNSMAQEMKVQLLLCGDCAVTVAFPQRIDEEINSHIRRFCRELERSGLPGVTEYVPTYCGVTVHYDPELLSYTVLEREIYRLLKLSGTSQEKNDALPPRIVRIPVVYGGEWGPDLENVAKLHDLTPEQVIAIHSGRDYLIYMLGFTPGFPYLGGMDPRIATPRLKTPRTRIPAGSVGIAGEQTGVYPLDSPGGWQLIGRTPLALFDPGRAEPFLLSAGDKVRFCPILPEQFEEIRQSGKF